MSDYSKTLVGNLIDVQGAQMIASLIDDEQGQPPVITIGREDVAVGRIGSYVAIRQAGLHILAMVTRMTEQEALGAPVSEVPDEAPARPTFAKRIARLVPVGTILDDGSFQRGVVSYPTTAAEVHAVGSENLTRLFDKHQSKGYDVGTVAAHPNLRAWLDPTNLFGRHFAILGQTGAGKSWTVASLVQRAVKVMPHAHIIILDLHGEYCWKRDETTRHYAFEDAIVRHLDARDLEIPYWLMTYAELCELLVDETDFSAHNQVAAFRDSLRQLRLEEGKKLGLSRTSLDTPVWFDILDLRKEIENLNAEVEGKSGKMINGPLTGKFTNFLMRLDSKLNDIRYDFLLKPKQRTDSASLSALLQDFVGVGDKPSAVTVIDLSSVPFDVRPTVAAQIGRLAFEFNYWNPAYRAFPLLLICEEAHAYIPRTSTSEYAGARKSMERIAKEGRKYGVGLGIVSQRPHEVSETVLAQCGTFLCLRITNPDDQGYVRKLVPESEGDLVSILAGLGRGEALALGEAVPLPTRVQIDRPNPAPNSDDIDFHGAWSTKQADLDVDAIVQRWRNQER